MSNIVFSFDAQAYGVLAAVDAMIEGFSRLESKIEGMVESFGKINSQVETMQSAWGALFQNFDALQSSMQDGSNGLNNAANSASNLGYQLEQLAMRAQRAAEAHTQAVQRIEAEEARLTERTQEEIARREQSYEQSLQTMMERHAYSLAQIQQQEDKLSETYQERIDSQLQKLQNPRAIQHKYLTEALEQQIAALASTGQGSSVQAKGLESELDTENKSYNSFITNTIEPYYQWIDKKGYDQHQDELSKLKDRLAQEDLLYNQQRQNLQNNYQMQLSDLQTHYREEEAALAQHLDDVNINYQQQMDDIAAQRAHDLAGGGGSSGGAFGGSATQPPPPAGYIELFKQLGIDPSQDPQSATKALMTWIMGGTFRGQKMDPQYLQSQMTIPQMMQFVTQSIAEFQDPTRNVVNGENYTQIMSDLLGYTAATRPAMSQDQRVQQISYAMEEIMAGNTGRGLLSLERLGMNKELLIKAGLKFGKGGRVENPQDAYMAVLKATEAVAGKSPIPGMSLGQYQATHTVTGILNEFKDVWNKVAIDIGQSGVWDRFREDLYKVFLLINAHIPDIERFGEGIATWVLGTFDRFFSYMQSANGQALLHNIGNAFHEIGDALHWLGQHKDILILLMGLLGAQMGSKLLGGLTLAPLQKMMSGGLFSGVGGMAQGGLGGVMGFARNAYLSGSSGAADAGALASLIHGAPGGVGNFANILGPMVPGVSMFEHIGANMGVNPGQARLAGLLSDPIGTVLHIGRETGRTVGRVPGNIAGVAQTGYGLARGAISTVGNFIGSGPSGMLAGIMPMLSGLGPAIMGLGPALAGIAAAAGPILLVVLAVAGLIAVLVANRDKIMPFINTLAHFFGDQLQKAQKAIKEFVGEVQDRLGPAFGPGSLVYKAVQFFSRFWTGAWGGIKMAFSGVWDVIVGVIKIVWSILSGIILVGLDLLGGKWGKAWDDIKKMFSGVWDGIKQILGGVLKVILGTLSAWFGGLWAGVSGKAKDFSSGIIKFFMDLPGNIAKAWTNLTTSIGNFFSGLWGGVSTSASGFLASFTGFFSGIPATIAGIFTNLPKAIATTFSGFAGMVIHALANNAGPLSGAIIGLAHTLAIPGFADGGYYGGGQLALVGERGPEMFFSRNAGSFVSNAQIRQAVSGGDGRGSGRGKGSGGHTLNIYGDVVLPHARTTDQVYDALNRRAGKRAEHGVRGGSAS